MGIKRDSHRSFVCSKRVPERKDGLVDETHHTYPGRIFQKQGGVLPINFADHLVFEAVIHPMVIPAINVVVQSNLDHTAKVGGKIG